MSDCPCMLDFEASGLGPESYPIEVAWSDPSGAVESHYIDPAPDWDDWDPEAEMIHWISRELLRDEGKPVGWVATRLNTVLAGRLVYCDAPAFDQFWLRSLFQAAGMNPAFQLGSFWDICPDPDPRLPQGTVDRIWDHAEAERGGRQHEAGSDVRVLIAVYRLTQEALKKRDNA